MTHTQRDLCNLAIDRCWCVVGEIRTLSNYLDLLRQCAAIERELLTLRMVFADYNINPRDLATFPDVGTSIANIVDHCSTLCGLPSNMTMNYSNKVYSPIDTVWNLVEAIASMTFDPDNELTDPEAMARTKPIPKPKQP